MRNQQWDAARHVAQLNPRLSTLISQLFRAFWECLNLGGTGYQPVDSGYQPESLWCAIAGGIGQVARFNGLVARSTQIKTLPNFAACMIEDCVFCRRKVTTRGHHVIPRCKGGRETVPTCQSCEDFIHKTWSHNELRDVFNTVEKIQTEARFQKFLRWLYKQHKGAFFRTRRNRSRTSRPYR